MPTTSAGDTEDTGGVSPADFCMLQPPGDYGGFVYVCTGQASMVFKFDFYGDPDIGLDEFAVCLDLSEVDTKGPGYVYSCFLNLTDYEFGPDMKQPNGEEVEVCCLRDSPSDAVEQYCHIDAAVEVCRGASDGLNELRKSIPFIPKFYELLDQLEALNKSLAQAENQTSCAKELAVELLDQNDVFPDPEAAWPPDDGAGWSWFRDLNLIIGDFEITDSENSGIECPQIDAVAPMNGQVIGGQLKVKSFIGNANAKAQGGSFSFRHAPCDLDTCEFKFEAFSVDVEDFDVGPLSFSDIHADMQAPAQGQINGTKVGFESNEMRFQATFRLALNGQPLFDGETVVVDVNNVGVAEARLNPGPLFGVQRIDAVTWPFEFQLMTKLAPCG